MIYTVEKSSDYERRSSLDTSPNKGTKRLRNSLDISTLKGSKKLRKKLARVLSVKEPSNGNSVQATLSSSEPDESFKRKRRNSNIETLMPSCARSGVWKDQLRVHCSKYFSKSSSSLKSLFLFLFFNEYIIHRVAQYAFLPLILELGFFFICVFEFWTTWENMTENSCKIWKLITDPWFKKYKINQEKIARILG